MTYFCIEVPKDWIEKLKTKNNTAKPQQQLQQPSGFINPISTKTQVLLNQAAPPYQHGFGFDSKPQQNDIFDTSSILNSLPNNYLNFQPSFTNDTSSFNSSYSSNFGIGPMSAQFQQPSFKQNSFDINEQIFNSTVSNDMMFPYQNSLHQQQQLFLQQQQQLLLQQQRQKKIEIYLSILPTVLSEEMLEDKLLSKYFSGKYTLTRLSKRGNLLTLKRSFENEIDYMKELDMIKYAFFLFFQAREPHISDYFLTILLEFSQLRLFKKICFCKYHI
jgi:hypothetical protein